jgi:hypothetical protein
MKLLPKFVAASGLFAALLSAGYADSLKIVSTSGVSNGGNGGSYTITILSGPANNSAYSPTSKISVGTFEGFCLEPNEYFSSGSTYNYTIASYAFGGGNEAVGRNGTVGDQLSKGTTWLYSLFATGGLAGFDYGVGRQASNLLLQRAVWYLEDDYNYNLNDALANPFLQMAATEFGGLELARGDAANGAYGVWALNLTSGTNNSTQNQSQLYYVPDGGATAMLVGLGFLALGLFTRTVRQNN